MSNFFKIIISFFIVVLISIIVYIFIFSNIFNIKIFNFLNAHLENTIQKDLNSAKDKIDAYINNIDINKLSPLMKSFDFQKFTEKAQSKNINISNEMAAVKNLTVTTEGLDAVKLFDNKGKLIFSNLDDDRRQTGGFSSFNSSDQIERNDDFYTFKENMLSFIFDSKRGYIIFKKNISIDNNPVGIMLFYFKDNFLTDILRSHNYSEFKKPFFVKNNILILYKPDEVPEDYLFSFNLDQNKLRSIVFKDKSGNEIRKTYRLFFSDSKRANLTITRFVDNEKFILDRRREIILFYTFFFTLYLLVLTILLFRKNEYDKLKDKSILFSISILDEILKAKSKEELENLHNQFNVKKENFFKDLLGDFQKIKSKDKKVLEDQLQLIFNKIDESFEKKMDDYPGKVNFDRIELLFEKFIETIAKKGININAPVNLSAAGKIKDSQATKQPIEVEELDEAEAVEELEEAEAVEELSEAENVEELESKEPEEVEEAEAVEELEEAETVEELSEAESIPETKKTPQEDFKDVYEIETEEDKNSSIPEESLEVAEVLEELEDAEAVEELEESSDSTPEAISIPKVPKEFYQNKIEKNDDLANEIKKLSTSKDPLNDALNDILKKTEASSILYLARDKGKYEYLKNISIGNIELLKRLVVLNKEDVMVQRLNSSKRIIYAKDLDKIINFFSDIKIFSGIEKIKSFIIYPVKSFFSIKTLIIIFFPKAIDEKLDNIITLIEDKNLTKILK